MKKISLIATLALGGLLACCNLAKAQDSNTNSTDSTPKKEKGGKRGAMFSPEAQLERMSTELSLTEDQKPKVKAVLEDTAKQRQGMADLEPDERRTKMQSIRDDQTKKLKEILTPDQFEKYQKMMQDMGKRKKKQTTE